MTPPLDNRGPPLLEVTNLVAGYGDVPVLHDISLRLWSGQFVVMLGRNGAGKSTLLHAMAGLIPKRSGRVVFNHIDITDRTPAEAIRAGLSVVLERHRVFAGLTVDDNLLVGGYARGASGDRAKLARIYDFFPELKPFRHEPASRLSGGQQEILAIAQGVIADPTLLVLDEPSGGLAPLVIDRIFSTVAELCRAGMSVLLVEQMVEKALRHADYVYLVDHGRLVGEGSPEDLRDSELLREVYLGRRDG
jgi:branched-chain amino acid transport system ATP-binding protein